MFRKWSSQCRHPAAISILLLMVIALCWGQNFGIVTQCPHQTQHFNSAEQVQQAPDSHSEKCELTSQLLQQTQSDLNPIIFVAFAMLALLIQSLRTPSASFRPPLRPPKQRFHLVHCCFLE